jgi:hypothetical protein
MRKFILALGAFVILASSGAAPAQAAEANDCIEQCNADFPTNGDPVQTSIRGWCYILRGCWAS